MDNASKSSEYTTASIVYTKLSDITSSTYETRQRYQSSNIIHKSCLLYVFSEQLEQVTYWVLIFRVYIFNSLAFVDSVNMYLSNYAILCSYAGLWIQWPMCLLVIGFLLYYSTHLILELLDCTLICKRGKT